MAQKVKGVILGIIGYILSPLSWWNDPIVNIPLAYGFASAFGLISQKLFFPMMVIGYWATNVLGLVLMHYGIRTATQKQGGMNSSPQQSAGDEFFLRGIPAAEINIKKQILISLGYTILIVVLIKLNILKFPTEYFR